MMDITIILILIIIVLTAINVIMLEWPSLRTIYIASKIHGVRGLPIIGSVLLFLRSDPSELLDLVQVLKKKYPKRMSLYVCGIQHVMLFEPEDVQVLLSSTDHIQKGIEYDSLIPWLNKGLLISTGAKWHARRKLLTPTFHFRILDNAANTINRKIDILIANLSKVCDTVTELDKWVPRCTLDIIGETAMGIDLKAQLTEENAYVNSVKNLTKSVTIRLLSLWQLKDWIFNLSQNGKIFSKNLPVLHQFTDQVIKMRKQVYEDTSVHDEDDTGRKVRRVFLDSLIETQRSEPGSLSDLDIREEVDTFMFEGHDTTSAALNFAIWLLGTHVEQQDMVLAELKEVLGDEDREVTMFDTHKLVYLEKVIKETLRLYPSVPYISRRLTQDLILDDGTVIPTWTNTDIMPHTLHRNERFFPDPEKFDPERFSEENSVGRHPFVYIPFSAGPRNCIGQKFAMLEMKMTLAKIFKKFSVKSITRRDEFKLLPYLIIKPTVPLKVVFSLR